MRKYRMRVRIDKTRQDDATAAVDLDDFLAILLQPRIAQRVFGAADGNNLAADAENGSVIE